MSFAQFPVKPRHDRPYSPRHDRPYSPRYDRPYSPNPGSPLPSPALLSPLPPPTKKNLKRERRVARIIEPRSPTYPAPAYIPERPAPILELPGLPPRTIPRASLQKPPKNIGHKLIASGKNFLDRVRPKWLPRDPTTPTIPAVTPKTAQFVNDTAYNTPKDYETFDDYERAISKDDIISYYEDIPSGKHDPPPLFAKSLPDGGLTAWASVAGAFMIQFATIGYMFTWNVFEDVYNHSFMTDQSPVAVRFVGSLQWFFAFFLCVVSGKLVDMGLFHFVVPGGSVFFALCLFLLSITGEEELGKAFVFQGIGMGIGMGLVFVPTIVVPLYYFKKQRGFAVGIAMSGASLGGMVFPTALRSLIPHVGVGSAVRATAIIATLFLAAGNAIFLWRPLPVQEKPLYPVPRLDLAKYSQEMEYIYAAGGMFLAMFFIYYPVMYLDLIGIENGVGEGIAFNAVLILSLTGIMGRIGLGYASDIIGPWNLLITVSGGLALMMFTMSTIQGVKSLVFYALFYGAFAGAWLSLMTTALVSLASRPTEYGVRIGLVFTASSLAVLFSFLLQNGLLASKNWAIPSAISGLLFMGITGLAFMSRTLLAARKTSTRRRIEVLQGLFVL